MRNREEEFKVLYQKYLNWQESQEGQTNGYEYEKSFDQFIIEFGKELFQLSTNNLEEETKKKVHTKFGLIEVSP
jgi:hypothetical protein